MKFQTAVNLICAILGTLIVLFGLVIRLGMIDNVIPAKGMTLIVLGAIIAIFSWWRYFRKR